MATLLTPLPAIAFPHELDTLRIATRTAVRLRIATNSASFETTLTPNAAGEVVLEQLADYLREVIATPTDVSIYLDNVHIGTVMLIPCRWDIETTAEEFCKKHFLTAAPTRKTTYLKAKETISWWNFPAETAIITAQWMTAAGVQHTTHIPALTTPTTSITTADCSPQTLIPPTPSAHLIGYTITVGERTIYFHLPPIGSNLKGVTTISFLNIFYIPENFHFFGSIVRETKNTYTRARIGRTYRNLTVKEEETYQATTGSISQQEYQRISDLITTPRAWRGKKEIVITDADIKEDLHPHQPQMGTITWREKRLTHHLPLPTPYHIAPTTPRIFDSTFDSTFE